MPEIEYSTSKAISYRNWAERNPEKRKEVSRKYYIKYRSRELKRSHLNLIKIKTELFDILGHKCMHCGFTDKRALQFDHINGGGVKEIKKFKSPLTMLRYSRSNPIEAEKHLQVLCANCNWIKRAVNDEVSRKWKYVRN